MSNPSIRVVVSAGGNVSIERPQWGARPGSWIEITSELIQRADVPDLIAALQALAMPVAPVVPAAPANAPAPVVAAAPPPSPECREDAALWAQRALRSTHDAGLAERVAAALRVRPEDRASSGSPVTEERFGPRDRRER